ncbi:MAG TPA: methylmalonyl-CoA mutase family protein, partial [Acidimicrobiia bacterium]|nr:methylmalonyl-CoA mutase family protein [Acidimicrobiia bacterium]
DTVDPLAGSYFVEALTDQLQAKAEALIDRIEALGGAVAAIEDGWMQAQIEESAYREARRQSEGASIVVGVNRFQETEDLGVPVLEIDPSLEEGQKKRLEQWRSDRNAGTVRSVLGQVEAVARSESNLLPAMKEALAAGATLGEVSDRLRNVFGSHRPG